MSTTSATLRLFRSLKGQWAISRTIHNQLDRAMDTRFEGTAEFVERQEHEYVYKEEGLMTIVTAGHSAPAQMRYVYRYTPADDRLAVYRTEFDWKSQEVSVTNWFHDIVLDQPSATTTQVNQATGTEHLCVRDWYKPFYRFKYEGSTLNEFTIRYEVSGPHKDYVSEAVYTNHAKL